MAQMVALDASIEKTLPSRRNEHPTTPMSPH
jgi:hypothetical protein